MNKQPWAGILKQRVHEFFHPATAPRVMLFIPAVLLKLITAGISGAAFILRSGPLYITGMIFWVMWIVTLFLIALPSTDRWLARTRGRLKRISLILAGAVILVGALEFAALTAVNQGGTLSRLVGPNMTKLMQEQAINFRYNDGTALCHQAIDNLLAGKNPYTSANIVTANLRFNNPYSRTTPLQVGRFANDFPYPTDAELQAVWEQAIQHPSEPPPEIESQLNYPAACFLLPAPFIWAGVDDLRWIYLVAIILGLVLAIVLVPPRMRLWMLAGGLASIEIWESIASGETGSLAFPFLLLAWLLWRRKLWLSALCMGVAVATKQVSWFFVPFYLILIWRSLDWKRAASALAIAGGVFLAFNIAFIAQNPAEWFSSIMAPMTARFFPLGVGPVTLAIAGYIHTQSSLPFTIMEAVVMLVVLIWYWRNTVRYPHTGLVLAVVPLFFAWRSSWWYFFYFDLILLAVVMLNDYDRDSRPLLVNEAE